MKDTQPKSRPGLSRRYHAAVLAFAGAIVLASFFLEVRGGEYVGPSFGPDFVLPNLCMTRWFGGSCPGCGLTRSFIYLAHGDLAASWQAHHFGWLLAGLVLAQIPYRILALRRPISSRLAHRLSNCVAMSFSLLLVGNWLVGFWM